MEPFKRVPYRPEPAIGIQEFAVRSVMLQRVSVSAGANDLVPCSSVQHSGMEWNWSESGVTVTWSTTLNAVQPPGIGLRRGSHTSRIDHILESHRIAQAPVDARGDLHMGAASFGVREGDERIEPRRVTSDFLLPER